MQPIVLSGGFNSAWTDIDQASTKYLTSVYFVNTNLWYFLYCFFLVSLQFSCNLFTAKPNNAREGRPRSVLVQLVTPCDTFSFHVKRFVMVNWSRKNNLRQYFKVSTKVWRHTRTQQTCTLKIIENVGTPDFEPLIYTEKLCLHLSLGGVFSSAIRLIKAKNNRIERYKKGSM